MNRPILLHIRVLPRFFRRLRFVLCNCHPRGHFPSRARHTQILFALLICVGLVTTSEAEISSYAFVQDDGSLRVRGRTIHLDGIYIPPTSNNCRSFQRPIKCAPRAALALDFKIGANFVHCEEREWLEDGSLLALCRVDDEDLAAYLLSHGWALALREASFEYHALERIARHRGLGVWGIQVDRILRQ